VKALLNVPPTQYSWEEDLICTLHVIIYPQPSPFGPWSSLFYVVCCFVFQHTYWRTSYTSSSSLGEGCFTRSTSDLPHRSSPEVPPLKSSFPSFIHWSHPESSNHIADRALLFVRFFSFIVLIKWTLIRKRWVRRGMSWDRERGDWGRGNKIGREIRRGIGWDSGLEE